MNIFWDVTGRNQGQIVTEHYPQVGGSAEGEEGPAKGLRMRYDASDGEWTLTKNGKEIARGNRFAGQTQPSVEEAMALV